MLCQDGSNENGREVREYVLCLGVVQLPGDVGLPLSRISVVFVIMKHQKMLVMMEVYCYVDSTVAWCIDPHCCPDDDVVCAL